MVHFICNLLSFTCTLMAYFRQFVLFFSLVLEWVKSRQLSYLAVPKFIASGSHEHAGTKFRFMVMERFGEDIEKKFSSAGRRFSLPTVCYLALKLVRYTTDANNPRHMHEGCGHMHEGCGSRSLCE